MTYTEIFTELCPMYMVYGMTYDQYWYGDPWMVRAYAQAFLLKRKLENEQAWIQGAYVANAFNAVLATSFGKKKIDYIKQPLDIFPKTESEKQAEIREERKKVVQWLNAFRKKAEMKKNTGSDLDGKP